MTAMLPVKGTGLMSLIVIISISGGLLAHGAPFREGSNEAETASSVHALVQDISIETADSNSEDLTTEEEGHRVTGTLDMLTTPHPDFAEKDDEIAEVVEVVEDAVDKAADVTNKRTPNKTDDNEVTLNTLETLIHSVAAIFVVAFCSFGVILVFCQFKLVRELERLNRTAEYQMMLLPRLDPRQEPSTEDDQDSNSDRRRSGDSTRGPGKDTEGGDEVAGPSTHFMKSSENKPPRKPDGSAGKSLVSELTGTADTKKHEDCEEAETNLDETCDVDKGKLEKIGDPQGKGGQKPSSASGAASKISNPEHEKLAKDTRRISNGSPSPRKVNPGQCSPKPPALRKTNPVDKSAFDVIG